MSLIPKKYKKISKENISNLILLLKNKIEEIYDVGNYDENNEYIKINRKVFEPELWSFGEQLRIEIKKNKKILDFKEFHSFILDIIKNEKYRSARQSFVLLLEDFKLFNYSEELVPLLNDSYVYGHILSYLVKGKIKGYKLEVNNVLLKEKTGWIKKLAEKYIEFDNPPR